MSPDADRAHRDLPTDGDAYVRQQLASIDGSLFNGMPVDDRYESGVPETQRGNSLDFIQMTGLTRAPLRHGSHGIEGTLAQVPIYEDLNPSSPVSFFEKGVADVDDTIGGENLTGGLSDVSLDRDLVPSRTSESLSADGGASRSVQAFRDIVAGLQRGEMAPTDSPPADVAPLQEVDEPEAVEEAIAADDAYTGSASGALLALVEELESVMGQSPSTTESSSDESELSDAAAEPEIETPVAPLSLGAPAAEITDDDFDELLSSLSGHGDTPVTEPTTVEEPPNEASTSETGIADDWDALLDSMTVRGDDAAPKVDTAPARKSPSSGALAEAEQLMQALEKRPVAGARVPATPVSADPEDRPVSDDSGWVVPVPPMPASDVSQDGGGVGAPAMSGVPVDGGDTPLTYEYTSAPSRRRSRRHSRVVRRGRRVLKIVFFLALFAGLLSSAWFYVLGPILVKDEDLSVQAARLMSEEQYGAASKTYLQLASRIPPGDAARADAEFRAAYALTLGPTHSWDDTKQRYQASVALFKQFTEDYPQHTKRARALSIMGRLYFELQDFEQAIIVLRDQVKPADDPAAALSMLRYLARAYSMTGNYDHAETSYLQAATLPGNYSAESDYLELGDLFRRRAEAAKDPAERATLKDMATSYWRRAMQVPGIALSDRNNLEERLQWLSFTEQAEGGKGAGTDGTVETAAPATIGVQVPEAAAPDGGSPMSGVPAESAIPAPLDETGRAEIPGAELEALLAVPTPAAEPVTVPLAVPQEPAAVGAE